MIERPVMVLSARRVGAKAERRCVWNNGKVKVDDLGVEKAVVRLCIDVIEVAVADGELVLAASEVDRVVGVNGVLEVPLGRVMVGISDRDEDEEGGVAAALTPVHGEIRGAQANLMGAQALEEAGAAGEGEGRRTHTSGVYGRRAVERDG